MRRGVASFGAWSLLLVGLGAATGCGGCQNERTHATASGAPSASAPPVFSAPPVLSRNYGIVCDPKGQPDLPSVFQEAEPVGLGSPKVVRDSALSHGLRLRILQGDGQARAELVRGTKVEFAISSAHLDVDKELRAAVGVPIADRDGDGEPDDVAAEVEIIDRDITGDGEPELVLRGSSGGVHCCDVLFVVRTGPAPCLVDTLGADHVGYLTDLDHDGVLEFVNHDAAWHDFDIYYTWQIEPELVHRYERGAWRLSGAMMRKPAPKPEQIDGWLKTLPDGKFDGIDCPNELCVLRAMLRLTYTGHPALAWNYFAKTGDEIVDKERFAREFEKLASESEELRKLGWVVRR